MNKNPLGFVFGVLTGAALTMLYLHRDALAACIKGEPLPEAPAGCPFSAPDALDDEIE